MQNDDTKPDERDLLCGWRSFRPKVLQKLNSPKWFLVFLTLYSFMQGKKKYFLSYNYIKFMSYGAVA